MNILTAYNSRILSSELNKKVEVLLGKSCVVSGFNVTGTETSSITVGTGVAIISGAILIEDKSSTILSIPENLTEKVYLQMEYKHQEKSVQFKFVSSPTEEAAPDGNLVLAEIEFDGKDISKIAQTKQSYQFMSIVDIAKKIDDMEKSLNSLSLDWGNIENKPTSLPASDVYPWAKQPKKPAYSASEITGLPTSLPASGGNADMVDGLHSWQMGSLDAKGGSHGTAHYMTVKHNVNGDNRFKLLMSGGHQVAVDYATEASNTQNVKNRDVCAEIDSLKKSAVDWKTPIISAIDGRLGHTSGLTVEHSGADIGWWISHQVKSRAYYEEVTSMNGWNVVTQSGEDIVYNKTFAIGDAAVTIQLSQWSSFWNQDWYITLVTVNTAVSAIIIDNLELGYIYGGKDNINVPVYSMYVKGTLFNHSNVPFAIPSYPYSYFVAKGEGDDDDDKTGSGGYKVRDHRFRVLIIE